MPSLRERLVDLALGPEKENLQRATALLMESYARGPWELPPDELLRQLREYDSTLVQDLVTQLGYEALGSMAGYLANTEAERARAVDEARRLYRVSPLAQWTVWCWTNFGLGEAVQVVCDDPDADKVWQETWTADRNADLFADDQLHDLSNWLLTDGNLFLACFASTADGAVTFAEIDASEIAEIVTNPANKRQPLFYKRVWTEGTVSKTAYYPDWQAYFVGEELLAKAQLPRGAVRADQEQLGDGDQPGRRRTRPPSPARP